MKAAEFNLNKVCYVVALSGLKIVIWATSYLQC